LVYALAGSNGVGLGVVGCGGGGSHSVLDLLRHGQERLLDISCVLRRSLEERNGELVCELLGNGVFNDLLARQIRLVANKELVHALGRVSVSLLQPLLHVCEGVIISYVIDNDNTMSASVVRRGDGTESFLTGSIPNLEFHGLALEFNGSNLEVDANS